MRDERTPFLDVVDSFFVHRHDLSMATRANYQRRFDDFAHWCEKNLGHEAIVGDVEGGTVEEFLGHLRVTVSAQTARSAWTALRSIARYLADRRIRDEGGQSVLRLVRVPKVKDETRRALTDNEMWRLLEVSSQGELGQRDGAIVWTLLGCGLRRGELVGLRICDVNVRERQLRIRASTSKSVHARECTIPIETAKALDNYAADREDDTDDSAPFFTDRSGQALTGNGSANSSSGSRCGVGSRTYAHTCSGIRGLLTSTVRVRAHAST